MARLKALPVSAWCAVTAMLCLLALTSAAVAQTTVPLRINCPPNLTNWICGASSFAFATYPTPTTTGSCPTNAMVTCTPPSGSTFTLGTTMVTCRATNSCRESAVCSFALTVAGDTTPPIIQCPGNLTVPLCGTASTVPVTFPTPTATDNADTNVAITCVPPSGSLFPVGTTTVTCTATDDCTNRLACTFTATVARDVIPPAIQCPSNIVVLTCDLPNAVVTYLTPTATDNLDSSPGVVCIPRSGENFPVGTTTVTCTATDDCNNRSNCTFTVSVNADTTPPVIECPSNMVFNCVCPGQAIVLDFFKPTVTDDHDPNPTIVCVPPSLVSSPGVHVVTCTATDNCGNSNRCSFTVTFNYDTTAPTLTCPTNMTVWSCSNFAVVNYSASATDTCDANVALVCTPPSGSVFPAGTTAVVCTATDNCTNRSTCTFTVTVNSDTTPPSLACPTNIIASICSTCAVSQCVANVPPPIRPASVGNGLFYGSAVEPDLTFTEFGDQMNLKEEQGYHAIHVNAYQPVGASGTASVKFGAAWVRDDDSAFASFSTRDQDAGDLQFVEALQEAWGGSRPISLSGYKINANETRFTAAYLQEGSVYPWRLILDRDFDQYQAEFEALAAQGYRPISVSGYSFEGVNPRYSGIFVQDGLADSDWATAHRIAEADYEAWHDQYSNEGFQPISLSAYTIGEETFFTAVMVRVPNSGFYVTAHGMTESEFLAANEIWTDPANEHQTTFRPVVVAAYRSFYNGGAKRYAAVWRGSATRAFTTTGVLHPSLSALDDAMQGFMQLRDINAATLCVSKNGSIVHHRGYNWAPAEFRQTQPCSRFRIASASKPIAAIAVMQLIEANYFVGMKGGGLQELTLDTPVFQINSMPDLPAAYGAEAQGITIRHLLQHRAGWDSEEWDPFGRDPGIAAKLEISLPLTRQNVFDYMMTPALWPTNGDPSSIGFHESVQGFPPFAVARYSNFGFSLLARLVEILTNEPYETYVRNHILLPVGAHRTRIGHSARLLSLSGPDEVTYTAGLSSDPRWYVSDSNYDSTTVENPTLRSAVAGGEPGAAFPTSPYGASNIQIIDGPGGWVSTSDDLVRLLQSFDAYNPGQPDTDTPLLGWQALWEMWSNPANTQPFLDNNYVLGWQTVALNGVTYHYHRGDIQGALALVCRRSDGVTFAALFSRNAGNGSFSAINNAIDSITRWPVCQDSAIVNFPAPIATDNVDANVSATCLPPPGSSFPLGSTPVTCSATDNCGNSRACTFLVTVKVDDAPPSIQCPTNRIVWTCSTDGAVVVFPLPGLDDDTDPNPSVVCAPPSGSLFPVGRTVVSCTATDECTNRSTCTFTVTVNADTVRPVIACTTNQTVWTCNTGGVAVNYPVPMVLDNHDPNASVVCAPASGSVFPVGTTTVVCTATDNCTNRSTCTFTVTVNRDASAPTIQCPTNVSVFTANPAGRPVYFASLVVTDDPEANVSCAPAPGSLFPVGVTPVVCTARDACGHERSCAFTVEVILLNLQIVAHVESGNIQLKWLSDNPNNVGLETADEVSGPWLPIRGATSPFLIQFLGPKKFFRLTAPSGDADCGDVVFSPSVWNIDVPSVRIQGRFLLNSRPFPSSFLHGANFFLRRVSTGDEVYLGLSNNDTFDRRVVPGIYDVIYEHKIGDEVPLNTVAVVIAGLEISGDQVFDIDVPSVGVGGAFQFNGAPAPVSVLESGRVQLRDRQNGALTLIGETTAQTYSAMLIPGAYDFMYSRIAGGAVAPANHLTAFRRDVSITANGVLNLDVPTVSRSGQFLINGALAPNSATETGRIFLLDPDTGARVLLGETRVQSYQVILIPGAYDVQYERIAGGNTAPANHRARFLTGVPLLADGAYNIDLPSVQISGAFRVNGAPAPAAPTERGNLFLRQGDDQVNLGQTSDGAFQVLVVPGTYQVHYTHVSGSAVMPANTNAMLGSVVIAGASAFDIDIPVVAFTAEVKFNGGNFPGPNDGESARLYLDAGGTGGLIYLGDFPSQSGVSRLVVPGTYRVRYAYESGVQLPRNSFAVLGSPLVLTQSVQTVINIRAAALHGSFLLNGAAFPGAGQNAAITLRSLTQEDSLFLGGTPAGAYSTVIIPGHYTAYYNWAQGDIIPRNQNARLTCPR